MVWLVTSLLLILALAAVAILICCIALCVDTFKIKKK